MKKCFKSFILLVGFICIASTSHAVVENVKACSLAGPGFFYLPGTDTCFNPTTGVMRQMTENGYWTSAVYAPGNWVQTEKVECPNGKVFKVGTFSSNDFTLNAYNKYETAHIMLRLGTNEFISKVMMSGGFAKPNFCLSFYDPAVGPNLWEAYQTMGCVNPSILMEQPAVFSFTPLWSVPPSIFTTRPVRLVGNNGIDNWGAPPDVNTGEPPPFDGAISCWVCIQKAHRH